MAERDSDAVQLTDLEVIQQFSLAVRGATATRGEVIAALEADLAFLTSAPRKAAAAPKAAPAPDQAPAPAKSAVKATAKATEPAKKASAKKAASKATSSRRG